ncbi:group III truncated hemoglobin [Pedobacter sp. SD-b]|uniref:Group III truncated hemoglobin n=1 Tax=Pedobacter segetis TaxID=2793069 RepID=A0ABS1BIU9_9SPHI|nr:group III truncated hemoglobin [Pedobacter segetis]MBK0382785.1 group III truncated hemoglobin [Pedobacter segetis]
MKKDIETHLDIKLMVDSFYDKATADKLLGPVFNDIAKVDWDHHLPIMYSFWEATLLSKAVYKGNPMDTHFKLNQKIKLTQEMFNKWKTLFIETIEENFVGKTANDAKQRAVSIADLMFYKINN